MLGSIVSILGMALVGAALILMAVLRPSGLPSLNRKQQQLALVFGICLLVLATFAPLLLILLGT